MADAGSNAQKPANELVQNILKQEKNPAGAILEKPQQDEAQKLTEAIAPKLDTSILESVKAPRSILLILLKIVFGLLIGASVVIGVFFLSQLTDYLDPLIGRSGLDIPNVSTAATKSNDEVIALKTEENFYRFLEAKGILDQFSYYGDDYLQNYEIAQSQTANNLDKQAAEQKLIGLRDSLKTYFLAARDNLKDPVYVMIAGTDANNLQDQAELTALFEGKLRTKLREEAAKYANSENAQAKIDYKNFVYTSNIVGNRELMALLTETDFDSLTDSEVYSLVKKINKLVVNDLSIIQQLKDQRIRWSDVINEIDRRTLVVDKYYSKDFYAEFGGIRYNSYDFDSKGRKISIAGETKRFDATNFTMIAGLIDELNNSEIFENAEMRSFRKSGSTEDGYTATLKLTFDLIDPNQ